MAVSIVESTHQRAVAILLGGQNSVMEEPAIAQRNVRFPAIGLSLGALLLSALSAFADNEVIYHSCDPNCGTNPPKSAVFMRQIGDFDANGANATASSTLAKSKKGTMVKVNWTFEWFNASTQFRPFYVRINGKYPAPDFTIILNLDQTSTGEVVRSGVVWFDIDGQESVYPGQFYGQPMTVTFDSNKTADAGNSYELSMTVEVVKKK